MTRASTIGSYRFIAELGSGGMADVYLAAVEGPAGSGFTKLAVLKMLRSHLAEDPEFVSMLLDEARVTARLAHPNVVDVFEMGHVDDQYFLAMEFLEGQPLNRVAHRIQRALTKGNEINRDVPYVVISDVLAGLHHAHELADYDGTPLGVVHRDVTPHNVFVTYDGVVKVVDFGIAKAAGRQTETRHGVVKGKVRYMSPEQATGKNVDRRTDVFAAGVMLWNLSAGVRLWGERTDIEVVHGLVTGNYDPSPRAHCPDVPLAIDAICRKALAKRREDRYLTAEAMRADLETFLGARGAEARRDLAAAMKDLFAKERAKLRLILQNSSLTSAPSIHLLAASTSLGSTPRLRAAGAANEDAPPCEHTEKMPCAPARPRRERSKSDKASLAPVSVHPGSAARVQKSRRNPRPARSSKPSFANAWTFGLAAFAVIVAFAAHSSVGSANVEPELGQRSAATVDRDATPFARELRSKAQLPDADVVSSPAGVQRIVPSSVRPTASSAVVTARPSAPVSPPTDPDARKGPKIDAADPWTGAKP